MSYERDREFSDRYLPEIRRIVGGRVVNVASMEVDTKQAGDLIVLYKPGLTIACRVRRPGYMGRYPTEFTIRAYRESEVETELAKLRNGWGSWFFYAHAR